MNARLGETRPRGLVGSLDAGMRYEPCSESVCLVDRGRLAGRYQRMPGAERSFAVLVSLVETVPRRCRADVGPVRYSGALATRAESRHSVGAGHLGRAARSDGRGEEGYLEVVRVLPKRADVHHRLALLYSRKGECQAAEPYFQKAIQLDSENAELHCDLGYNHYLQKRWPEAEASLRQAIALDGSLSRARNNLGLLLARTGREPEAMREFAMAGCDRAQASANLGLALMLEGRAEHAHAEYRRALEFNPNLKAAQTVWRISIRWRPTEQPATSLRLPTDRSRIRENSECCGRIRENSECCGRPNSPIRRGDRIRENSAVLRPVSPSHAADRRSPRSRETFGRRFRRGRRPSPSTVAEFVRIRNSVYSRSDRQFPRKILTRAGCRSFAEFSPRRGW
jgi:Tfp pilus assembly protein PilF